MCSSKSVILALATDGFLHNFLGIEVNLRRKISTKKLPLPQVGSNIFLSTAEISGSHKSHICLTMFSGVNTRLFPEQAHPRQDVRRPDAESDPLPDYQFWSYDFRADSYDYVYRLARY